MDHWIPKSLGGPSEFSNYRNSCQPCNNRKGCHVPDGRRHPVPPPRPKRKTRAEKQALKQLRNICERCFDGRINIKPCEQCGRLPMTPDRSHAYKVKAHECLHDGTTWCWFCCLLFEEEKVLISKQKQAMLV